MGFYSDNIQATGKYISSDGTLGATITTGGLVFKDGIYTSGSFNVAPGGASSNVQINRSGLFYGDANFTYDEVNKAVGIGTPLDTSYSLTINTATSGWLRLTSGATMVALLNYVSASNIVGLSATANDLVLNSTLSTTGGNIRFNTDSSNERMRVMNSGLIGIGTTAPDKQLEINSSTGACLRCTYNDSNGTAATYGDFSVSSVGELNLLPAGSAPFTSFTKSNVQLGSGATLSSNPGTVYKNLTDATSSVEQVFKRQVQVKGWQSSASVDVLWTEIFNGRTNNNPDWNMYIKNGSGSNTKIFQIDASGQFGVAVKRASFALGPNLLDSDSQPGFQTGNDNTPADATDAEREYSPAFLSFTRGWKTNATAGGQYMSSAMQLRANSGAANPNAYINFLGGINTRTNPTLDLLRLQFGGEVNGAAFNFGGIANYVVSLYGTDKLQFRDTAIGIYSQADSFLNLFADGGVRIGDSTPTNYTQFDSTGHQTMVGTAKPWRDQLTDALSIKVQGTGVAVNPTEGTVEFATNADYNTDYMYCNIQLNHDKDLTASIYPHIHFFQTENAVPNFLLEYRWQINMGEKVTSWTKLKCNTVVEAYSGTTKNNIAHSTAIAVPPGTKLSDIVQFRIYRDTTNDSGEFGSPGTDTYTTAVGVTAFDVHFQTDSIGSTDEYTK